MKVILEHIAQKTSDYEKHPLYAFLRDEAQPAEKRLAFVPSLAHFVMSFADLYAFVLRDEPARDRYQTIVNAHTYEDGGHWKWFLADLKTLGQDPMMRLSESLRFIWSDQTTPIRMLTYRMCRLGLGATSLEKLVLVHCIEASGKVALSSVAPAAVGVARHLERDLIYFGKHHIDTEMDHTLEDSEVQNSLESVVIDAELRPALLTIVNEAFAAFQAFADAVLEYASTASPAAPPQRDRSLAT